MAGVVDATVPVIVVAVPLLAAAGMDSAAIVGAIQMDLSASPLSEEMRMSPTAPVVGFPETIQSAVMIKMTRMADDSEAAGFESQMDWHALEHQFAFVPSVELETAPSVDCQRPSVKTGYVALQRKE